jgi:hypothetical protein
MLELSSFVHVSKEVRNRSYYGADALDGYVPAAFDQSKNHAKWKDDAK